MEEIGAAILEKNDIDYRETIRIFKTEVILQREAITFG